MVHLNRRPATPKAETPSTGDLTHEPENAPKVPKSFERDQLYSFVERLERLDEEKQGLAGDRKEVVAEAKGSGFDTKIMNMVIRRRKMDAADRMEQDDLVDLYERAVREASADARTASEAEGE